MRILSLSSRISHGSGARAFGLIAASLVGVLIAGCGAKGEEGSESSVNNEVPRNVRVVTVEPFDLNEFLTISGPARPLHGTDLNSEETGQVMRIPNDKGSVVRAGESIVVLDRRLLEAEMRSAVAGEKLSAFNEERTRTLFEENAVSEVEMLQATTELERSSALADVAKVRYDRAATRAPFAGIVADRYVELGQFVAPGMPVARIVDPYVLKLVGAVTEREIRNISKGTSAVVRFEGVAEPQPGTVHWVGIEADPKTGKFGVEIHIENPDLTLRPGVVARASVLKTEHEDVIAVPRDAIVDHGGAPTVFVVEEDVARQRRLSLGSDQGLMVIVEDGLRSGEKLIVRGQRQIHDGSAVLIREEATDPDGTMSDDPKEVMRETPVPGSSGADAATSGEGK